MKQIKNLFKNPLYLVLGLLVLIISYMYLVDGMYYFGTKIGKSF